jgi:gas vesicle protein
MENTIRANKIRKSVAGLLAGLLLGGLAGYGTMLLLAPQSGKMTRDQIGQKGVEFQNQASDAVDELVALSHFDNRKIEAGTWDKTLVRDKS